jgi:hypothetical protein
MLPACLSLLTFFWLDDMPIVQSTGGVCTFVLLTKMCCPCSESRCRRLGLSVGPGEVVSLPLAIFACSLLIVALSLIWVMLVLILGCTRDILQTANN